MDRIIGHIDMDAFYSQVEHQRFNIPLSTPLCVQQWNGLIAVNYAARKFGIERHSSPNDAKKKCPGKTRSINEMRGPTCPWLVSMAHFIVATYALGEQEPKYHSHPSQDTHKVSLDVYRRESFKILSLLKRFAKKIEKASIDEAFIDLTPVIHEKYPHFTVPELKNVEILGSHEEWTERLMYTAHYDRDIRLLQGAMIMKEIRMAIFEELGYTSSAGVAINKPLAKLCSSMHKPNRQVVLLPDYIESFMKDIPLTKIPGLGGKLGESLLERFNVKTCGEIWNVDKELFGSDGEWLYLLCRGISFEEIRERSALQSITASKNFQTHILNKDLLLKWIWTLIGELTIRVGVDVGENNRLPSSMTIHTETSKGIETRKTAKLSRFEQFQPTAFQSQLKKHLEQLILDIQPFPCKRISVSLGQFNVLQGMGIGRYFTKSRIVQDGFYCTQCQKRIFVDSVEHEDYHFAKQLQEEESKPPLVKRTKISDFFTPSSKN